MNNTLHTILINAFDALEGKASEIHIEDIIHITIRAKRENANDIYEWEKFIVHTCKPNKFDFIVVWEDEFNA